MLKNQVHLNTYSNGHIAGFRRQKQKFDLLICPKFDSGSEIILQDKHNDSRLKCHLLIYRAMAKFKNLHSIDSF